MYAMSISNRIGEASTSEQVNGTSMSDQVTEVATLKEYTTGESALSKESQTSKESDVGSENVNTRDESLPSQATGFPQPEVGMVFHSEEQAYRFYNSYAKRRGFSVRKGHRSRRKDGSTRIRIFLCSNEGSRQQHRTHVTKKPRALIRTNCVARIEYKVDRDNIWIVSKFIDEHNHPLMNSNKIHMLRSHRKRLLDHHRVYNEIYNIGLGVKYGQACTFQINEDLGAQNHGFVLKNQNNKLHPKRVRGLEKGDSQFLLDILKFKQLEDPAFFYAIQLDEKERLSNFFWADARSIVDYTYFGDAVSLDTTYRASIYDIPFAPFLGVNHHKQIVVFGAALLLDETVESFIWLFKTFVAAMSEKQPKTIFTDNCAAISDAISITLPETCHRLCLWQILQTAPRHLSHVYNSSPNFQKDFKNCICEHGSEDDFVNGWNNLMCKHNLSSNSWLQDLYAVREKWALVYRDNAFCATLTTTEWSQNMGNYFKVYFYRKLPFSKFITQYRKALLELRETERFEDCESMQTKPVLLVDVPMLSIAAESYTRMMYKDFEEEYKSQLACFCEPVGFDGTLHTFRVSLPQKHCYGLVEYNATDVTVTCSCKKFESMGILCMHALKVLNNNNILHLAPQYILKRWTKDAKFGVADNHCQATVDPDDQEHLSLQYNRVWRKAIAIAVKSAVSKDALELVERRLDKFMLEREHMLHSASLDKQTKDVNNGGSIHENSLDAEVICFDIFE